MTLADISNIRILNQRIEGTEYTSAKELVAWMGAMQAQDYSMAKWAVGLRMQDATEAKIEAAYNKGEIIRTHLMRPTWHFVSADDFYWMLELTAPQIKPLLKSRDKQLELNSAIYVRSNRIIESALSTGKSLTREDLAKELERADIKTDENRFYHLMLHAELDCLVCSGPIKGNKLTYALLSDRVPVKKILTREESLAELAKRYFTSHCPASLKDFVWWSGLSVTEARKALESVKSCFISETIGSEIYWFTNAFSLTQSLVTSVHLLPAFDEYLISYRNRSASLSVIDNKKTVSVNGIFRPVIVVNGQVTGLWKRTTKKDKVLIETKSFQPHNEETKDRIEKAAKSYENFMGKETKLIQLDSTENKL